MKIIICTITIISLTAIILFLYAVTADWDCRGQLETLHIFDVPCTKDITYQVCTTTKGRSFIEQTYIKRQKDQMARGFQAIENCKAHE